MECLSFLPLLFTILSLHNHCQLPSHHFQQHHIPPTNLHLISPLNSLLASGSLANPLGLLHLHPNSSIDALMTSKKIYLPYSTISPTNKPASVSSPSALYKNYHISSLRTSSFTYLLTILTHPGKTRTAHLPPPLILSSKLSLLHSSIIQT
jgi:hypothetical protein